MRALQAQRRAIQATNQEDEAARRIKDQMRPGMREYLEGFRQARALLRDGKISQAEYTAEKARLA